jgi:hypothetical protein
MSNRYKGGVISATPPTTTGGESGTASGAWTLEQQMQLQAAGLWPSPPPPLYIENVFSTYLYTGNASTQAITNGIDLSTKGGLVWIKPRASALSHTLTDTVRGRLSLLVSNTTAAQSIADNGYNIQSFNSNGFTLAPSWQNGTNSAGESNVAWTFREQPKFFDVVTYTGNGTTQAISHNLGSTPGCVMVKCTSTAGTDWFVWHRALTFGYWLRLNTTGAQSNANSEFNFGNNTIAVDPTSTVFTVGNNTDFNGSGRTYVAYLFAHDAGGFGLTETENVISCGSVTTDGSGVASVTLGYEPQLVLMKNTQTAGDWVLVDNMRGFSQTAFNFLTPNTSSAEGVQTTDKFYPTATGFYRDGLYASQPHIYIAIRRGPMAVPTVGTSVFVPYLYAGLTNPDLRASFPVDSFFLKRTTPSEDWYVGDRLRGDNYLATNTTAAEASTGGYFEFDYQNGAVNGFGLTTAYVSHLFRRAPGFFDEVCYTGTGANRTVTHNLTVAPELMIIKKRSAADSWAVYSATLGAVKGLILNSNSPQANEPTYFNSTSPTASVFTVGTASIVNGSGSTYVAYLFSTLAGVSKVGSYTGTGSTQTINCGFTSGARFVLIKRTNDTGDWYVWDTARGMVSGTDPYLRLNENYSQNNTNSVYTTSVGFQLVTSDVEMNANGSTYIFLAIA